MKALFKSHNLIGDALYVGPALRAWIKMQNTPIDMWMQTLPDHVAPLYEGMVRDLWNPGTLVHTFGTCFERPAGIIFDFEHVFDVNKAFALSDRKKCHIAESYAELLGVNICKKLRPTFIPDSSGEVPLLDQHGVDLSGCILVSMFSNSCTSRDKNHPGLPPNKMLPWEKWIPMLHLLREMYPNTPIRFIGAPTDTVPNEYASKIVVPEEYMLGIPLNRLALIMLKAKLLVTIDNGMSHLGASQCTPTFLMYPRCLGKHYIVPENPNLIWVHIDPVLVNAEQLRHQLQYAVNTLQLG